MTTDALGLELMTYCCGNDSNCAGGCDCQCHNLRRRAEQAEELLREAMHLHCLQYPYDEVDELRARVAAHFDSTNTKGDDK